MRNATSMSIARRIGLSVYIVALAVVAAFADDSFLWLKIVLFAGFLAVLFWPRRRRPAPDGE